LGGRDQEDKGQPRQKVSEVFVSINKLNEKTVPVILAMQEAIGKRIMV
jgi:hypothetical protein